MMPPGKARGSVYSLAKRGSQVVSSFVEETQGQMSVSFAFFLHNFFVCVQYDSHNKQQLFA